MCQYCTLSKRTLNRAWNQFATFISSPWQGLELMADADLVTWGDHDSSSYTWLSGVPQVCRWICGLQNGACTQKFQIPTLAVQLGLKGGWIVLGIWNIHTQEHISRKKQANLGVYKIKGQYMLIPLTKHDIPPTKHYIHASIYNVPLLFTRMNGTALRPLHPEYCTP